VIRRRFRWRIRQRIGVLLVAVLLVTSVLGPAVAPTASAQPSGMVTLGDEQISEQFPGNAQRGAEAATGLSVSDLEGSVYVAPEYADTTEVIVTTPGQAKQMMGVSNVLGRGPFAIVVRDTSDDRGRTVAFDRGVLEQALGRTPELIRGTHSSGETWRAPVEYTDETARVTFDHFSSNTVTFSGTVNISGTYMDGSETSYELTDLDAATDPTINLTGELNTELDTETVSDGSGTLHLAGTSEPVGPDGSGEPVIEYAYSTRSETVSESTADGTTIQRISVNSWYDVGGSDISIQNEGSSSTDATVTLRDSDNTEIASRTVTVDGNSGYTGLDISGDASPSGFSEVEVVLSSGNGNVVFGDGFGGSPVSISEAAPSSFVVTHGSSSTSVTGFGGSGSTTADLALGDKTLEVDTVPGSPAWTLTGNYTEVSETVDPSLAVNGEIQASHSGTLSDGTTVSLTGNKSVLEAGTNTITVSTGSVSSDAPSPTVDLSYSHSAQHKQSVNYTAEKFAEKYNVSKTYAEANENPTLTIRHDGTVIEMKRVETRTNDGTWKSTSDYTLDNTTLTVNLPSVSSGDTVDVRTTGRKIAVSGGSITVVEPTPVGERLDTKIRIDSWSDGARLGVGADPDGRQVHYTYDESVGGQEYARIHEDGAQQVYLPATSEGSELRVSTIPVEVEPASGEVDVKVRDPMTSEPQFTVEPGPTTGDTVEYTFVDAKDGQTYVLYSKTDGVVRDSGTATSPLTLEDDDSEETIQFQQEDSGSSSSSSESLVGGPIQSTGTGPLNSVPVVILGWVGALVVLYIVDRGGGVAVPNPVPSVVPVVGGDSVRIPLPGARGPLFWVGSTGATLLALEFLSSGLISRTIFRTVTGLASGLEQVVPLAGLVTVGLVAYYLYQRFIVGQSPRDIVIRSDGGRNE